MYFLRLFFSIVLTAGIGFGSYAYWLVGEIKKQHAIPTKEILIDFSNRLASDLTPEKKETSWTLDGVDHDAVFKKLRKQEEAKIKNPSLINNGSEINAYVTDARGYVIYDSHSKANIGKDFSEKKEIVAVQHNRKKNGNRSELITNDPFSHIYYVSTAIKNYTGHPIGAVSVSQSVNSILYFIPIGQDKIQYMIAYFFVGAVVLAFLFSYWLARPIRGLIKYAQTVTKGESARPPKTSFRDFHKLGTAFEEMRISLEKKESVKNHVNDVTHALKSPLTAIKATAELLEKEVPQDKVNLFLNIEAEADRANRLLNDLLKIAKLEARVGLDKKEKLSIKELIEETLRALKPLIEKKKIKMIVKWGSSEPIVRGERFLILQIFENIISNAIDFSPMEGKIIIESVGNKKTDQIFVRDQGPGIPVYAKDKIFDKFYSLQRPTGEKSTGLGLALVKEALSLHNGGVQLEVSSQEMSGANFKISFNRDSQ
tara:strand:+ start:796 stop:2247 length:1452 start_codon:yes stop_codon:yes gene_type:complete